MSDSKSYTYNLIMPDGNGEMQHELPQAGYRYISIINGTRNTLSIYQEATTRLDAIPSSMLVQVPMYTMITIPLLKTGAIMTYIWEDGGQIGLKFAQIMYSDTNLGINGLVGNPGSAGTTTITGDGVGLARKNQLPETLLNGNLKVSVMSGLDMTTVAQKSQFPNTIGQYGGLKTEIVSPLSVDVKVPVDSSKTWGTGKITPGAVTALDNQACREVTIIADASNTAPIKFGDKSSTCVVPLPPGGSVTLPVENMSMVYTQSDQAATLYYIWRS